MKTKEFESINNNIFFLKPHDNISLGCIQSIKSQLKILSGAAIKHWSHLKNAIKPIAANHNAVDQKKLVDVYLDYRKRMSLILRCPDGKVRLYCKGADTMMMVRVRQGDPLLPSVRQHLVSARARWRGGVQRMHGNMHGKAMATSWQHHGNTMATPSYQIVMS
jgi:hypothetical protein